MELKLLSCPLCSHPHFNSVDVLRNTLVSVATSLLTCPVCSETLLGLDKLTIHLFSHINGSTTTVSTAAKEHFQEEIDKSIDSISKCETTEEVIADQSKQDVIKCDICNFSFTDRNILEMHQKLLHQTIPDNSGTYSYHCHLCSKKFRMRGSLMVHLRVAHYGFGHTNNNNEEDCSKSTKKRVVEKEDSKVECAPDIEGLQRSPSFKQDNKQWECDVCSKMFTTKYFLKKHKRLHTGEMPYCCSLCNKSFTFQQSYHKHMLYHSSEKPYPCNECGRAFKELSTLQNHSRIHSGERPFSCETCGKSFRQRVSYLVHRRIHTGVMPYKCTACEKCFRYKVSQKSHKCPMNPPGTVIRIPDPERKNQQVNSPEATTSTNISTSHSVEAENLTVDTEFLREPSLIHKTSIVLGNNQQIEISYNKADLQSAITQDTSFQNHKNKTIFLEKQSDLDIETDVDRIMYNEGEKYLFSMVLSPIMPEVESLCLNGSPLTSNPSSPIEEALDIISQKSLEDFL